MDASPTDNSVLAPNSGAAIGPLSLEISPPYYPQFLATRSLSAPAQGPTHMVDYAAVRQDHRAHAQGFSLPGPSQPPASYFYSHASSLQPPAYAAQQAEYTGLPSPQNSSPYYNYLQPPVMQQRSQSHPAHYTASGHYSQNPAHIHTRSYTDSQETTSQPPRPVVSITRPPVQSTGLEQRLNALSIETGPGHYSTTPPLTRAQSAVSSYVGTPMGEPIQMEYFARMPPAGYKTCGAGATAVLDMMQMARTQSVASTASGYSDPGSPPDEGNMPAGGVSPHEQICDFSEFFEGFSVSE
ncbi:hypothetical protein L227DRAFT_145616 [Lentinus tigrinus ALCF2SS1-6]|uniref:Uncharacterized protein n=1 Tax=Lentinus tigrinus ALCF2SS1-6 TaxID=1328759 RepID=A0A5C2ST48_9APHY|nr:hypothetical protein L227DRAFT_145616 [Lentinus tigrinus ALCF2SS1-6]